jgi:hypothetical protein
MSRLARLILVILGFGVLSVEVAALAFVRRSDALYIAAVVMGVVFVVCSGYAWALTLRRPQDVDGMEGLWSLVWIVYWAVFIVVFFGLLPGIILQR